MVAGEERASPGAALPPALRALLACAGRASPEQSFDPMERAIHEAAAKFPEADADGAWRRVHEYPLSRELLAVTHVWGQPGATGFQVMCKGAPEAIADLCGLQAAARSAVLAQVTGCPARSAGTRAAGSVAGEPTASVDRAWFAFGGAAAVSPTAARGVREAVASPAACVRVISDCTSGDRARKHRRDGKPGRGLGNEVALDGRDLTRRTVRSRLRPVQPDPKLRLVDA